ncbi:family 20 glycosylhydrolase [Occultella kanbiaonis]|uniref:family 20 glycosylhydrolase n=1 Tax=Occultella kanbiaonis TaxID=2675754 RepID=UPI0013CFF4B3|nr:family 20 glycosylhydrolase [Occultella kanbiaonis]
MSNEVRGVLLDVGRKRFEPAWIERLLERMGELGLNTLQLHLSDSVGLGVELPGYAHLARPDALTALEVTRVRAHADRCGVAIVPELDTPSHATPLVAGHAEWMLRDRTGQVHEDRIDLSSPDARRHLRSLWDATCELFEPDVVHLGGDEFLAAPWEDEEARRPDRFPTLLDWARAEAGAGATAEDAFALHVTELVEHLRGRGCSTWLWNDHVVPATQGPLVPVPTDVTVDVWVRWRDWTPSVHDYLASGYQVLNSNGDLLYFVLSADGKPALTGPKSGVDIAETFRRNRFMGLAGQRTWLDVAADDDRVRGAKLSVWCDSPGSMTEAETWDRLQTWLTPFAGSFSR